MEKKRKKIYIKRVVRWEGRGGGENGVGLNSSGATVLTPLTKYREHPGKINYHRGGVGILQSKWANSSLRAGDLNRHPGTTLR